MASSRKISKIFDYCRIGNLDELKNIVDNEEVDVNIRDKWDSTPLYYACLCGHENLVEYLLQKGARCDSNSFDGERCLYSALTLEIKRMLKEYKAISKDCIRRNKYVEFFKRALSGTTFKDVCFVVHGVNFLAHRLVLSARSPYFAHMFVTKWDKREIIVINNNMVSPKAFELLLQYVYTDRMEIPVEILEDIKILLKQCYLFDALEKLLKIEKELNFYTATKPISSSNNVSILSFQPTMNSTELNESFSVIPKLGIPFDFSVSQFEIFFPDIFYLDLPECMNDKRVHDIRRLCESQIPRYSDVCFVIDTYCFYGHKLFFSGRSEYFKALLHFQDILRPDAHYEKVEEDGEDDSKQIIELKDIRPNIFTIVYTFIYTESAVIPDEYLGEVLHYSCLYMLPTLKTFCTQLIKKKLDSHNVCDFVRAARLYDIPTLEQNCAAFIASNLEDIIDQEDFIELLRDDLSSIRNREEADSVPFADDINFHLFKGILPMGKVCDIAELKVEMLEGLLNRLEEELIAVV